MTSAHPLISDTVALFPGQGSITGGAGEPWRESPHWHLLDEISAASGMDVATLLLDTPTEDVVRTDRAQIATFALSMISWHDLISQGRRPKYLLGHSLGEFSALTAAGLLTVSEGARLIGIRGAAMADAAERTAGTMVAVMGGDVATREQLDALENVWVANINGTGQIVLSGTADGLAVVLEQHKELGWKRATPLPVGGAFHSPLMSSAQERLDEALATTTWGTTEHVLIANVDGRVHTEANEWQELLSRQLTSPVEFLDATLALPEEVTKTIELAPGSVLTGLTKRIRDFAEQAAPASYAEMKEYVL